MIPPLSIEDVKLLHALAVRHRHDLLTYPAADPGRRTATQLAGITRTLELVQRIAESDGAAALEIRQDQGSGPPTAS
jgi:hypothetical protein